MTRTFNLSGLAVTLTECYSTDCTSEIASLLLKLHQISAGRGVPHGCEGRVHGSALRAPLLSGPAAPPSAHWDEGRYACTRCVCVCVCVCVIWVCVGAVSL